MNSRGFICPTSILSAILVKHIKLIYIVNHIFLNFFKKNSYVFKRKKRKKYVMFAQVLGFLVVLTFT